MICRRCKRTLNPRSSLKRHEQSKRCQSFPQPKQPLDTFEPFAKLPRDIQLYVVELCMDNTALFQVPLFCGLVCTLARRWYRQRLLPISTDINDYTIVFRQAGKRLTLSKVKSIYKIDHSNLQYDEATNPHYRSAAPMKLFDYKDVLCAAIDKYGSIQACLDCYSQRKEKSNARSLQKHQLRLARRNELISSLKQHGCDLRADSRLCALYIEKGETCGWSLQDVVMRMCQMKYLFEYQAARTLIRQLRHDYYYYEEPLIDVAESIILERLGGAYPQQWPWLATNPETSYSTSKTC